MIYVIIRSGVAYDSHYTAAVSYYLSKQDADKACADANAFIDRAGLRNRKGNPRDGWTDDILYGDDAGTDAPWDAWVTLHGGLPDADPSLNPTDVDGLYGLNWYKVRALPAGKVSTSAA